MALLDHALTDGAVVIRPFEPSDREVLLRGRDDEFYRFLGDASSEPAPVACVHVDEAIVGWIDYDADRHWLDEHEVNVGYNIFPEHRGNGYGSSALRLLSSFLDTQVPRLRPTLLIDDDNGPSLALAARAGFEHVGDVDGAHLLRRVAIRSHSSAAGSGGLGRSG